MATLDIVDHCGSLRAASCYRMALRLAGDCMPASMTLDVLDRLRRGEDRPWAMKQVAIVTDQWVAFER